MLNNIIKFLRAWDLPFLIVLLVLNLYCAFMVNPLPVMEGGIDVLHMSIACVMAIMLVERLEKKK